MIDSYKNSYKVREKELVSLAVYSTGHQMCTPEHQWGPGIRDHFLLHHVISGKGYYKTHNKLYNLKTGDTFLIYPFDEVTYFSDKQDPWEYSWVGFSGTDAKILLTAAGFSTLSPVIYQSETSDYIKSQLLNIYDARGSELYNAVEMTGHLYTTLSRLLLANQAPKPTRKTSYALYTQKAVDFIHSHYSYPIKVTDIANYIGISRSHLFRAFQETMNQSPKDYLTTYRINQACILLSHSDFSIAAIGRSVGFEDNLNFSKTFKNVIGMSPRVFSLKNS